MVPPNVSATEVDDSTIPDAPPQEIDEITEAVTRPDANGETAEKEGNWWWKPDVPERPMVHHPQAPFHLLDFIMKFRWMVIIPVVLPLSFIWARVHSFKSWLQAYMRGEATEKKHQLKVLEVQKQIRSRDPSSDGPICTARPTFWSVSNRTPKYKRKSRYEVNLAALADIVNIDLVKMQIKMEPYVNMGQITSTLLPLGVCVAIVPEYDDLTVGGLTCGYGIEGSSHKYGLFYDECIEMEVILASGEVVTATRENEHSDLFHAIPWSYGAIGMLVSVTMKLIPIKPYMKVTYYPVCGTIDEMCAAWDHFLVPTHKPWAEYVEGLIYSSTKGVIMTADYVDESEAKQKGSTINSMGYWFKPWFHKHVLHNVLDKSIDGSPVVEYVPTRDYYHRHTRSLYWEADLLLPMGNNVVFRYLLGWLMPPRVSFLKLASTPAMHEYYATRFIAQDILVPLRKTAECMKLMHDEFEIYPLWLCPHRVFKTARGTMLDTERDYFEKYPGPGETEEAQMYTDLGIWYTPGHILRGEKFDGEVALNCLENWLIKNHGYQTLYAVTEMSEVDFWKMFDKTLYQKCRERYGAIGNFMDVYYKVGNKKGSAQSVESKKKN